MKRILGFAMVALFLSCQQGQKQEEAPAADPNAITCEGIGPVKLAFDHDALVQAVGAENITDEILSADGVTSHITKVFQNKPEELWVVWAETEAPYKTITEIQAKNTYSPYTTENGVRIGSTLDEIRNLNNFQPISMTNFYSSSDGFANVTSFNGGDLELNYPCLGLRLDIIKQKGLDVGVRDEAKEETELKSSHRIFSMLDVEVVEISIKR